MAENTGKLAGKTIFITGASRGIGKAIALKAAKDGANVVIAAKTTQVHPKLPGTIYTAAREVEAAGGRCLPCIVDVRNEADVRRAVEATVQKFGGIDVLVNNASAISLTATESTPLKKYDLMNQVNARGTFLCSHVCIPYLKQSSNPHILNISPPLNMNPKWFRDHVAYTIAKYGMSMCALGMSEEFKDDGIAVNALWPKTIIHTAATQNLGGGDAVSKQCRTSEIMADAAYVIVTRDSRSFSGHLTIDEDVLRQFGVSNFDRYAFAPGNPLALDLFLDEEDEHGISNRKRQASSSDTSSRTAVIFNNIGTILNEDLVKSVNGIFQFSLTGAEKGEWYVDLKNGKGSCGQGVPPSGANCILQLNSDDFNKLFKGELNASAAFLSGQLKIKGDIGFAMKLEKLMSRIKSKL